MILKGIQIEVAMNTKTSETPRYLACQCIRQIVGKVYGGFINMNLSGRLIQIISQVLEVDKIIVTKTIADYFEDNDKEVDPDDFSELVDILIQIKRPPTNTEMEMEKICKNAIKMYSQYGWGTKELIDTFNIASKIISERKRSEDG